MAGRDTRYTHKQWVIKANEITDALGGVLAPALTHMHASLVQAEAGRAQLTFSARSITLVNEDHAEGTKILAQHGPRLRRVSEAQRAAGGLDEVAGRKRYNQR